MHDHRIRLTEPQRTQRAALELVLGEHPALLTLSDLAMEIEEAGDVASAVKELTAIGLLRREGESIVPTRAALAFDRLSA